MPGQHTPGAKSEGAHFSCDRPGAQKTNVVVPGVIGTSVYKDMREPNASRRFKLFGGMNASGNATACSWAVRSLVTAVSRDGIHWTDWKNVSEMNVAADTLNLVLWDSQLGRYLAFTRRHW